jgi:type VI protein secretion system component VasK
MLWTLIAILLLAVLVGTLWMPIYNRTTPTAGGWPFFYWYQLLWVPVVALVSWVAYLLSKLARGGGAAASSVSSTGTPPAPPLPAPPAAADPDAAPPPLPKRQVPPRTEGGTP